MALYAHAQYGDLFLALFSRCGLPMRHSWWSGRRPPTGRGPCYNIIQMLINRVLKIRNRVLRIVPGASLQGTPEVLPSIGSWAHTEQRIITHVTIRISSWSVWRSLWRYFHYQTVKIQQIANNCSDSEYWRMLAQKTWIFLIFDKVLAETLSSDLKRW